MRITNGRRRALMLTLAGTLLTAAAAYGQGDQWERWMAVEDGFVEMFNGEDLDGWVNVNGAESTYFVRDGMVVTSGQPHGVLRSDRHYENFILELEYRHIQERGNAGLFIWSDPLPAVGVPFTRSIEIQIIDGHETENYTSHGDVFSIHGSTLKPKHPHPNGWARALPTERRANPTGEWNHYRVIAYDGNIKLAVNGKIVSEANSASPRKGYICLEAEGAETHFRNIKIRELPSTEPRPEDIADEAKGFRNLYNGVDLAGWVNAGHEGHWKPNGWVLAYDGKSDADDANLWTEETFGDFVLIYDWRWTGDAAEHTYPAILHSGQSRPARAEQVWPGVTPDAHADHAVGEWNRSIITRNGDRLSVVVNGRTVVDDAAINDVPERIRLALPHHGQTVDFANIYVRELNSER
ncbi:MAG: DUF1080 domain-containing protein [Phycisphaeraceae bacterium]